MAHLNLHQSFNSGYAFVFRMPPVGRRNAERDFIPDILEGRISKCEALQTSVEVK